MDIRIEPRPLSGSVTPPPSKSMAHRLLIAAGLARGKSVVGNVVSPPHYEMPARPKSRPEPRPAPVSEDVAATLRCLTALGARWEQSEESFLISGAGIGNRFSELPRFDCGESGSTLRFLIPIALAAAGGGVFTGRGRLMERPQQPYFDLFDRLGISHRLSGDTLTVRGALTPGEYHLPGNVSSQFFTGLLFALPLLGGPSRVLADTPLESRDYVRMTLDTLHCAGVRAEEEAGGFRVYPAAYQPFVSSVEADWSQAAVWYAAAFADHALTIGGLNPASVQGDRVIETLDRQLAVPGDAEIDLSDCPDLLPPLAVMAAIRRGVTRFTHGARLRLKESDRLCTTAALLRVLGVEAEELPDGLSVRGGRRLSGGTVDGAGDHRIVMAAAAAAPVCTGPVTILGAEAVNKSYPSFWDEYKKLGGIVHVL